MDIKDAYSLIAAELLKLNCIRLEKFIPDKYDKNDWVVPAKRVCIKEIRANPIVNKTSLKATAGFAWGWIIDQKLSTRAIYMLFVKWLLETKASFFTSDFNDLCTEFGKVIEEGYNGETDIPKQEIQDEWFLVTENYYPVFKTMINDLLTEDGILAA